MAVIDPSTDEGKLRLKLSDWQDIPLLPSSVYQQTLLDNNNNLQACTVTLGSYILGMLAHKTHRKLSQIEVWSNEQFKQYLQYLTLIIKDPAFSGASPIPYGSGMDGKVHEIEQFTMDWRKNYSAGTQSQQLAVDAALSPNDGSLYGRAVGSY